jgi:zinc transport system substrate-binding protein
MFYPNPHLRASLSALTTTLGLGAASIVHAQSPVIVTDIPVTHSLTALVTLGVTEPVLLLEQGADPHDFALRPSQARSVAGAGLAVWMGADMTPWMGRAVSALAPAAQLELLTVEGLHLQPYREQTLFGPARPDDHDSHDDHAHSDAHDHDSHDDHAHSDAHDNDSHDDHAHSDAHDHDSHDDHAHSDAHDHDSHDHHAHGQAHDNHGHSHDHGDGTDPHAWLDIDNAVTWLDAIAARLSQIDPANAATYAANAAAARTRLQALDADVRAILEPVARTGLVVHHDAFGYLSHAYGVNVLGSISLGDAATPGAARLSAIRAGLAQAGAVCIFPEVNHSDAHVRLVAEGTDLRIGAALDPEGVAIAPGPELYETLMRSLARSIADCATAG